MSLQFIWNRDKAASNHAKHGVSFEEAATAFGDRLSITVHDPDYSREEPRLVLIRQTFRGTLVVVVHSEQDESIRIISARRATSRERRDYEQA